MFFSGSLISYFLSIAALGHILSIAALGQIALGYIARESDTIDNTGFDDPLRRSKDSNIRMLTGTIKADWIQLPVERYLTALPRLKQGVIAGVFKNKGAAPWAITRAEKLQLSAFLPNDLSLDAWYAGIYALLCGLMCLCWEPTVCVEWLAMTFTTYGRSMMS